MTLDLTLTKENFWDETKQKYPKATEAFCKWIDEYKDAVGWNSLFGAHETKNAGSLVCFGAAPKFHDIPYAMQYGIWMEFVRQNIGEYFEQADHPSEFIDLREDINEFFKEIEPLIDQTE